MSDLKDACVNELVVEDGVIPFIARARRRFPRAWKPWSQAEELELLEMQKQHFSLEEMSRRLHRGIEGIAHRLRRLGCEQHSVERLRQKKFNGQPVPQMERIPQDWMAEPDKVSQKETAKFWNVSPEAFTSALDNLDVLLRKVFIWRYGLAGRCSFSLEGVAQALGVTSERVLYLQRCAERKMRLWLQLNGQEPFLVTLRETLRRAYSVSGSTI